MSSCIWNLGFFPNDARKNCPFVLTAFTGWSSERCPGIGFLSRGDREIGVLRNVEPPTRPRLECLRETGLILRCDRKVGNPFQTKQGSRPSCPDQEGRKGSEEGVPGNLSVPLEGDRDFGDTCVFTHTAPLCLQCIPWILSKQLLFFLQNSSQRSFPQQTLPDLMSGWDDLLFPHGSQFPCLSSHLPPWHAIIGLLSLEC